MEFQAGQSGTNKKYNNCNKRFLTAIGCFLLFWVISNVNGQLTHSGLFSASDSVKTDSAEVLLTRTEELKLNPFDVDHEPIEKVEKEEIVDEPFDDKKNMIFITMMVSLGLLSLTIGDNKKTFGRLINSLNSINYLKLFFREMKSGYPVILIILYLFFLINLSLFIFLITDYKGLDLGIKNSTLRLLTIFGATSFAVLAKHVILNYLTYVFMLGNDLKLYSFSMIIVGIAGGLALIPLNALIAFSGIEDQNMIFYIGIFLLTILYILLLLRAFLMSGRYLLYKTFHFFLYLCIIELMPIALVIKIISNF